MNLANISGETNLIYPDVDGNKLLKMFFDESKIWINSIEKIPMYLLNN